MGTLLFLASCSNNGKITHQNGYFLNHDEFVVKSFMWREKLIVQTSNKLFAWDNSKLDFRMFFEVKDATILKTYLVHDGIIASYNAKLVKIDLDNESVTWRGEEGLIPGKFIPGRSGDTLSYLNYNKLVLRSVSNGKIISVEPIDSGFLPNNDKDSSNHFGYWLDHEWMEINDGSLYKSVSNKNGNILTKTQLAGFIRNWEIILPTGITVFHEISGDYLQIGQPFTVAIYDKETGKSLCNSIPHLENWPPIINNGTVIANSVNKIVCYTINDGKRLWEVRLPSNTITHRPYVKNGHIYFVVGNKLMAVNMITGDSIILSTFDIVITKVAGISGNAIYLWGINNEFIIFEK